MSMTKPECVHLASMDTMESRSHSEVDAKKNLESTMSESKKVDQTDSKPRKRHWPDARKGSQISGLRELTRPELCSKKGYFLETDNSHDIKKSDIESTANKHLTVIMKPGVFAGMEAFTESAPELKHMSNNSSVKLVQNPSIVANAHFKVPDGNVSMRKKASDSSLSSTFEYESSKAGERTGGYRLLDAQNLKFKHPNKYWAPDINELRALDNGDHIFLMAESIDGKISPKRFLVIVSNIKGFPNRIKGVVQDSGMFNYGIVKGSTITFKVGQVFALHECCRDAIYERYVAMEKDVLTSNTGS